MFSPDKKDNYHLRTSLLEQSPDIKCSIYYTIAFVKDDSEIEKTKMPDFQPIRGFSFLLAIEM